MANWTVSSYSNAETQGDNVNAGSMAAFADLVITPNVGYVISATDFKIGGATESPTNTWTGGNVDSEIYKVVFSDIGTAGAVSNTVRARVHFDSTALGGTPWSMPGNDNTLYIDIDEKETVRNVDRFFCIRTQHVAETDGKGVNKHTVTYATAPTNITTTNNTPLVHNIGDGLVEHLHQGTVPQGVAAPGTLIFSIDFDANETYGYYYDNEPTIGTLSGTYSSYYTFVNSGHVYDANSKLIFVTIKGYYNPPVNVTGLDPDPASSASAMCELGQSILISHVLRQSEQGEPGSTTQITDVIINESIIDAGGEVRNIEIIGDYLAQATFKVVSSDSSKTYDFGTTGSGINGTFTASATDSGSTTWGSVGKRSVSNLSWTIHFPVVTSNTYYDIIVTPTTPTTATSNVPTAANELRIYQYPVIKVSLGLLDGANVYDDGELFDGDPNASGGISIQGRAGTNVDMTREFSYTIIPAMITAGSGTLNVKSSLDFSLDSTINTVVKLDGDAGGTSFDIDSTVGIIAGAQINWSIQKLSLFSGTNDEITPTSYTAGGPPTIAANLDNLVVGMQVTSSSVSERDNVIIESLAGGVVVLSSRIRTIEGEPLTFTARGVTVSSVTDANTLVASQTMEGVKDNFELTFGGGEADVNATVSSATVTKVGDNIVIAGSFNVQSFPVADVTVKLDLNELITIS